MKRQFELTIILVVLLLAGCAGDNVYRSSRQQRPLSINGFADDWQAEMVYDIKSGIMAGISNDDRNLYVMMKITSPVLKQQILMTGMTLWVDPKGKKKKNKGLVFPMKKLREGNRGMQGAANHSQVQKPGMNHLNNRFETGMEPMELINLLGEGTTEIANNISQLGINCMVRLSDNDDLLYEASIPLNRLFDEPDLYLVDSLKTFSVGFETGFVSIPMERPGAIALGSGKPEMGTHSGTGRAPGNRPGVRPDAGQYPEGDMTSLSDPVKYWFKKVILSPQATKLK